MASRKQRSKKNGRGRQDRQSIKTSAAGARGSDDRSADSDADPRLIDAMTVAWMLSLVACLLAEFGALVGAGIIWGLGGADQVPGLVSLIPFVLAFTAWITGTCCLGLTYLVLRIRPQRPPAPIIRTAVVAGTLPWLGFIASWLVAVAR
jgi:hypothetical protein